MADISVTGGSGPEGEATFHVEVHDGAITTAHTVTVPPHLPAALGWAPGRERELVRASFEFLLQREPATSILKRFSLEVIGDYFPEYPRALAPGTGDPR